MAIDRADDPRAFREFLDAQLAGAGAGATLGELLGRWEFEHRTGAEREETLAAIREGLADVEAGRTRPLEAFDREFRRTRGLNPRS
jgi:hypothetical protein